MSLLIVGLILFIGVHSIHIGANEWRSAQIVRFGEATWKVGYSFISLIGLVLIIRGFGMARQHPIFLWTPPAGMMNATALLVLIAFVLIAAAYVPRNHIKARLHHPMVLGVQLWAFGHLLANGTLATVILFGSFLIWAILSFKTARQRDAVNVAGTLAGTTISIVTGFIIWVVFLLVLHTFLIGVPLII